MLSINIQEAKLDSASSKSLKGVTTVSVKGKCHAEPTPQREREATALRACTQTEARSTYTNISPGMKNSLQYMSLETLQGTGAPATITLH